MELNSHTQFSGTVNKTCGSTGTGASLFLLVRQRLVKNRNFSEIVSPIGMHGDIKDPEPGECRKHSKFISVINHRQEQEPPSIL